MSNDTAPVPAKVPTEKLEVTSSEVDGTKAEDPKPARIGEKRKAEE